MNKHLSERSMELMGLRDWANSYELAPRTPEFNEWLMEQDRWKMIGQEPEGVPPMEEEFDQQFPEFNLFVPKTIDGVRQQITPESLRLVKRFWIQNWQHLWWGMLDLTLKLAEEQPELLEVTRRLAESRELTLVPMVSTQEEVKALPVILKEEYRERFKQVQEIVFEYCKEQQIPITMPVE